MLSIFLSTRCRMQSMVFSLIGVRRRRSDFKLGGRRQAGFSKKKKCGWANFLKLSYREFSHDVGVGRVWYDWGR